MFSIYDLKQTERSALVDEEHNVYLSAFPDDFLNKLDISNEDRENFIIGYLWTENPNTNVNNNESIFLIEVIDELSRCKQMAINEVAARMHQALFAVSVIDLMDYLNNYIALLNAGYYITDANREDKYFEVIEATQECEEPEALKDDATFEQEQEYIEKKQKYDNAQANLSALEKYLNSYDKLASLKVITTFLTDTRKKLEDASSIEEVDDIMKVYKSNLVNYKMVK